MRTRSWVLGLVAVVAVVVPALSCSSTTPEDVATSPSAVAPSAVAPSAVTSSAVAPSDATSPAVTSPAQGAIVVHDGGPGEPFDHRLLGTNLPAWVGPARLADPAFVAATIASGATVIRMP